MTDDSKQPPEAQQVEVSEDPDLRQAFEKLKERKPEVVQEFMALMTTGAMSNPLYHKVDPSHITQLLDLATQHDEREYDLHRTSQDISAKGATSDRRYMFAVFIVVVILFLVIMLGFANKPEILVPSLAGLGGLISGFLGGWGFGRRVGN